MLKLLSNEPDENKLLSLSLDEIARIGAKKLLIQALELEVSEYIERNQTAFDGNNHRQVVRNGKAKERTIQTGAGSIKISAPRVNDKREGKKFNSFILPRYLRKSPKIESLLPVLYLKGLSPDFDNAKKLTF